MPKVSVIVPVYGTEKFIERCARSLFEQTLDDMEFIFVDDCSPDNAIGVLKSVLDEYPNRKEQTEIKRMPVNSGLAAVRKYGVGCAHGDYLIACDSDDYVERDMYEKMYELAVKDNLDLVQCDIDVVDDSGVIRTLTSPIGTPSSQEIKDMIIDGNIAASLCNKLVRRSIYQCEDVTFPVAGMDEDNTMSCQLAFYSKKLGYIRISYYKAYYNGESMSRIPGKEQVLRRYREALDNSRIAVKFLTSCGYDNDSVSVIRAKIRPKNALVPLLDKREIYMKWKNTYPEVNYLVIFHSQFSFKTRIKFLLIISYMYPMYLKLKKI